MRLPLFATSIVLIAFAGCDGDDHSGHDHAGHDHAAVDQAPTAKAPDNIPGAMVAAAPASEARAAEIGCAACIYEMPGISGCGELAANIDGKPTLVSGHGLKIHSAGLCEAAKPATLTGEIEGDRFVATKVELKK